jgi:peptide/nickel transport system permease protein
MSEQAVALRGTPVVARPAERWVRVLQTPGGAAGVLIVLCLVLVATAAAIGWLPHPPAEQHPADRLIGPSSRYWFGTDQFGRDIAARVMVGIAATFKVALLGVGIAATGGTLVGMIGGFFGGRVDGVMAWITDVLFAFPAILFALALVSVFGPGWRNTAVAIGVVYLPIFVRVARGPVLALRDADFVNAGRGLGFSSWRLLFRHLLPNITAVIAVHVALACSWAILTEASLSFLGLGTQPPEPSLGLMISDARSLAATAWWTLAAPSLVIMVAVGGFTLLGDGLGRRLDPGGKRR